MAFGTITYGLALALMVLMLAGTILVDREHALVRHIQSWIDARVPKAATRYSRLTMRLMVTTALAGLILFLLPPVGNMPLDYQVALCFVAWLAWCYRYGVLSRRRITIALMEALPSLWLSLGWAQLLVLARGRII